jgi:L-2-hydroxyglutarate oxidase LhgO
MIETDFLIIGAGIMGLTVAKELTGRYPDARITVIDKEKEVAFHASGRNSGVLHAGFYYTSDSLKARFVVDGNRSMTEYCLEHGLSISRCGKVVVAKNEEELKTLFELKKRGDINGVTLQVIDEKELNELEPMAKTCGKALYSPTTSTVDPKEVCRQIARSLGERVSFLYENRFIRADNDICITEKGKIKYNYLINCAGLYADKLAHQFGIGLQYTILPFKGIYIRYREDSFLRKHIYPVPDLNYPFLGVHFTRTVDGKIKVGPTAIPVLWRENYNGFDNFRIDEFIQLLYRESKLFISNAFDFRKLAFSEMRKLFKTYLIHQAEYLVKELDSKLFGNYVSSGIRAQLLDKSSSSLVMDFVIGTGEKSIHVLNAVSPAFTCSFAFSKYIVDVISNKLND